MNKLFNKIAALSVGLAMAIGVGVAIGSGKAARSVTATSPATLTFSAACGGTGTDSDGNTWTITSDAAESAYDSTKGVHYGTGKKAVSYVNLTTSGITGTITQIVVNASGASGTSAKIDVTVGGNAFGSQGSLTSSNAPYTFTGSDSGTIVVALTQTSEAKALYCKSISVTYSSEKEVTSLDFTGSLTKTSYYVGDSWDYSGLSLTATYDNDPTDTEVLGTVNALIQSEDLEVEASPATVTATSVTSFTLSGIYNGEFDEVNDRTFTGITVSPARTISSIALHGTITKDEYFVGDSWDLTGLDIQVNWSSGDPTYVDFDDEDVTYELTPATATSTSVISFDIEVLYDEFDETFTVTGITVEEAPDVLNRALTGVSGTSYTAWSGKTSNSDAVYAGQSAGGNDSIQLRKSSPSGIWTTTSGGIFSGISVKWNSNTAEGRYITIYGKNSAYESGDLYDTSKSGTAIGTISKGSSTLPSETDLGSYSHIGILASGALYLEEIDINWTQGSLTPSASLDVNEVDLLISVAGSATAHVTINNCEDAEIEWSENSALIELSGADTETVTITPTDDAEVADVSVSLYVLGTDLEYSATLTVHLLEPGPGESPETAYSVADILALSTLPTENVYGTGYITTITEVSTAHGNATYNISDDKSATNQMVVYRGRYLNNVAFTSSDEIKIGDEVIVYGPLGTYNNLNQFATGNYLYSLERETPTECRVTYDANGGTGTMTDSDSPYTYEDTVTVLTNTFTRVGYTFDHWNTKADDTGTTYANGATFTITDNVTLYAQWSENPIEGDWILTDIDDLTSSDIFVIVGDNGNTYAMSNDNGTSAPAAVSVTIANDKITSDVTSRLVWTIDGNSTDGFTFYPNGSSETWLYTTNENNGVKVGDNNNKLFVIDSGYLKNSATSRYVGIYNSTDWRCYTSINNNIKDQSFAFYKLTTPAPTTSIISGTFIYDGKQSVYVEDIGVMVVEAPEGCTYLAGAMDYDSNIVVEVGVYDSTTQTVTSDFTVYADTAMADLEVSFYWYGDSSMNPSTYQEVTETIQIVNPTGLDGARAFAERLTKECHASTKNFSALAEEYDDLSDEAKAFLLAADYTLDGDDVIKADDTHYEIAEGMSRYDYMVEHLGMPNFMSKTGLTPSGRISFFNNLDITKNNGAALIIVIVSVLSVTAVGGYFLLKKKKTK